MASKHIQHTASPVKALYSIFVQPALTAPRNTTSRTVRPQWYNQYTPRQTPSNQTRAFASSPTCFYTNKYKKNLTPEVREQKWNEEITARVIQLVDPETKRLQDPVTRFDVLKGLDLKTHRLVQLTEPDTPGDRSFIPVCKIISKKESYEAGKQRKAQQKETKQAVAKMRSVKTLELNWAIDENDLGHRMDKVKGFLEEGRKVEIVLASKKRGRQATPAECQEVLDKIRSAAQSVPGVKEPQPFDGKMGGLATLVFQVKIAATK
ncbi:hypothetical protein Q7P37_002007 [Cladosporium fusiforme]